MNYALGQYDSAEKLVENVNKLIDEQGYKPLGGVIVTATPRSETGLMYVQAMIKED